MTDVTRRRRSQSWAPSASDRNPPTCSYHCRSYRNQVAEIVETAQEIFVEVRLEGRTAARAHLIDLVFVGINEVSLGIRIQTPRDLEQCGRMQLVVVVQEHDEVPRAIGDRSVRCGGDTALLFGKRQPYPRFAGCRIEQVLPHSGVRRFVVGDAELPVWIVLRRHRVDATVEMIEVRVEGWQNHRYDRLRTAALQASARPPQPARYKRGSCVASQAAYSGPECGAADAADHSTGKSPIGWSAFATRATSVTRAADPANGIRHTKPAFLEC